VVGVEVEAVGSDDSLSFLGHVTEPATGEFFEGEGHHGIEGAPARVGVSVIAVAKGH
jgi:predicted aconitase with swiveling domain